MLGQGIARRTWVRAGLVAAVVAAVGGVVVVGANDGDHARDVRLLSGAAWLSSSKAGQATLLDGSSAEVSAQVQVAPAGDVLDVVQQGSTAYVVDRTASTVRRVDGATFHPTLPESPIPGARAGLTAIPGPDALYTVDGDRGILADTDPRTLARRGELLPVAGELSAGTAMVDDAGRLWAIDTATGDLIRVAGGKPSVPKHVASPGASVLVLTNGHPLVVDTVGRRAISIDSDTNELTSTFGLALRKDDAVRVSGSAHAERLYLVLGRGALILCDAAAGSCDRTIPLEAGHDFGAAVEAGDRLFVPDYTTGQVWVVDLNTVQVVAKPPVLSAAGAFQLLNHDGVVFFNDPNSNRAGVIRFDGSVAVAVKYDADNPSKGLNTPPPGVSSPQPQKPEQPSRPEPSRQPSPPGQPPVSATPQQPGQEPGEPSGQVPTSDVPPPDPGQDPAGGNDSQPARLAVVMSDTSPTAGDLITLQVTNTSGPAPTAAHWTFGDGQESDGVTTSHKWTTGTYLIAVVATMPDGRQSTTSVTIAVTDKPTVTLNVSIPGGGGTISGGGINCPVVCSLAVEPGTQLTLTAAPDATHLPGNWGGACAGTQARCDLTLDTGKNITYTFTSPVPRVTLRVAGPTGGTVTGTGIGCPATCTVTVDKGTPVRLTANPNQNQTFGSWGGACAGTSSSTCTLTLTKDENVSVTFQPVKTVEHREFVGTASTKPAATALSQARADAADQAAAAGFGGCKETHSETVFDPQGKFFVATVVIMCERTQ
jgi:Fe-S cluster biogenesis protein NfuA